MNGTFDGWSIIGLLLVVGIALWGIKLLKQRLDDQRYRESMAELEFEGSVFSDFSNAQDLNFIQSEPGATVSPVIEQHSPVRATPDSKPVLAQHGSTDQIPAEVAAASVVQQLKHAGLFQSVEGYVEVHGHSKGAAIVLLRNGKRALLVPHMESEAFLRRHSKRVDMIIMVGTDGKGVVVTPVEELISQNILSG